MKRPEKSRNRSRQFGVLIALLLTATAASPVIYAQGKSLGRSSGGPKGGWQDDFSSSTLNARHWIIAQGRAPGYIPNLHLGTYEPSHVSLANGFLILKLNQENGPVDEGYGVISRGALIYSRKKYGYGTYEWRMRMSSTATTPDGEGYPVSGSVSAGFNYVNNSETEIDVEYSALPETQNLLYLVNWHNTTPQIDPSEDQRTFSTVEDPLVTQVFRTYRFVWEPGRITFYVDGVQVAVHTTNVPSAPAHFMINHWGTNSPWWGGAATVGTDRYFFIDHVSFTPL